uniref:Uncharacterized protein n=1 Tax=Arundo donax TaxID=35708 RepID=A0A0A8YRY1_ARUDO
MHIFNSLSSVRACWVCYVLYLLFSEEQLRPNDDDA